MKKIMICLLVMTLLVGCTPKQTDKPLNNYQMETIDVDMTIYHGMPFSGHAYKGIKMQNFFDLIDNKGTALIFIGYKGCGACQISVPLINQAAKQTDNTIYYIDATSYSDEEYNKYIEITKDFLNKDNGEPVLYTPSVMLVNDGEIIDNIIGIPEVNANGSLTKDQEKTVINAYKELLNKIKK